MKIGEAGEAFFVFETEEDVPEDLMTSPILQATSPSPHSGGAPQRTANFGAKNSPPTGVGEHTKDIVGRLEEQAETIPKEVRFRVASWFYGLTSPILEP